MIRAYKFRAWPVALDRDAFAHAVQLKRELWAGYCAAHAEYLAAKAALTTPEIAAAQRALDAASEANRADAKKTLRAARAAAEPILKPKLLDLGKRRSARFSEENRKVAAAGLHHQDYTSLYQVFAAACGSSAANGGQPAPNDDALGEQLVNGCGGKRFAALWGADTGFVSFGRKRPSPKGEPGSKRSSRRSYCDLDYKFRGPRNPLGEMTARFEVLMHRQIAADAEVREVRIVRRMVDCQRGVRIADSAGPRVERRERWYVIIVCREQPARHARPDSFAGVDIGWQEELGRVRIATVASAEGLREIYLADDHLDNWRDRDRLFAEAGDDPAKLVVAQAREARLARRRQALYRAIASGLARRYGVVAVTDLSVKSLNVQRNHGAPAQFEQALRHAVEAAGGLLMAVKSPRATCSSCGAPAATTGSKRLVCGCGKGRTPWENGALNLLRAAQQDETETDYDEFVEAAE